jgi:hypothetical protein
VTSHVGRLYALALGLVVFFLAWVVVAAHPWAAPAADRRSRLLAARELRLRHEARLVNRIVVARWAAYHQALRKRNAEIAAAKARAAQQQAAAYAAAAPAAPSVHVVTLPPITITRTS